MTEQIGKVILDLSKYPGKDLYSDGKVEEEILEIVQNYPAEEYPRVIEERKSWTLLYHLSHLRENIVDWIPLNREMKVLDVGSGCGAVTGALARKAGSVTCVDLSKMRSTINAYRHKDCDNIRIHVGNFKDIEPDLDMDYDLISLIGVFEYGQGYIGGETPYEDFLQILKKHLKPGGRMVIAIENKYGLKYFAGCREDHSGKYFESIENYNQGGGVRTFSRRGLEKIFARCGVEEYHFYYPYPDYKFMSTLYSDKRQPGKGELCRNLQNFDRSRQLLFDEGDAFDGLTEDGMFPEFSNSFLAVLGGDFPVEYVKYSNERDRNFQIRTEIRRDAGLRSVRKYPMTREAWEHICKMEQAFRLLSDRYAGGKLAVNTCTLEEEGGVPYASFDYVDGVPLSQLMDSCLERGDKETFYRYFKEYLEAIGWGEGCGVTDIDLIFANILVQKDGWTLIDYEWTLEEDIPAAQVAYRALYHYLLEKEREVTLEEAADFLQLTAEEVAGTLEREDIFQKKVRGESPSLAEMYASFGEEVEVPQGNGFRERMDLGHLRVQVYEDRGEGYTESLSCLIPGAYRDSHLVELELEVSGDVKMLRIDPMMAPCVCRVLELNFNGAPISPKRRGRIVLNGCKTVSKAGETGAGQLNFIFPTEDPNINIAIHKLNPGEKNVLSMKLEVARLPLGVAKEMAASAKPVRELPL